MLTKFQHVALLCLSLILREDALGSQCLSVEFVRTGAVRYVVELVKNISLNGCEANDIRSLEHCNVVMTLLIRLALTDCGWSSLNDVNALKLLKDMPLWLDPPKKIFLNASCSFTARNVPSLFMNFLLNVIYLCTALCSSAHWKKVSLQILELISCNSEILNHLMRTDKENSLVMNCGALLSHIHRFDKAARPFIEKSVCLNSLRKFSISSPFCSASSRAAFSTPRHLFDVSISNAD